MNRSVIPTIVNNDLCIGCGACAAMCPEQKLKMVFNHFGEYTPTAAKDCLTDCGLCLKVCPFSDGNDDEDAIGTAHYSQVHGISHRPETGYYRGCYVGYAADTRKRGSSGGITTWILSTLLEKGIVDYVIAVVPNEDPESLFNYTILEQPEQVMGSAGSVYYPVEMSRVLYDIVKKPGKYAIVGLPCFIKALRLAALKNRKVQERIIVTVGLVCGQMKSSHYTDYLSSLAGVGAPLKKVHYRGKSRGKPATDYYFSCTDRTGREGKIYQNDGGGKAWINRLFTPNACNYCDDVFAECADVTMMDAWLPEYYSDYQGTNFILVRSGLINELFLEEIRSGNVCIRTIPVEEIIQSQAGIITFKKDYLAARLFLGLQKNIPVPKKRVAPENVIGDPSQQREFERREQIRIASRIEWVKANKSGTGNIKQFTTAMIPFLDVSGKKDIISRLSRLPVGMLTFINRIIRS